MFMLTCSHGVFCGINRAVIVKADNIISCQNCILGQTCKHSKVRVCNMKPIQSCDRRGKSGDSALFSFLLTAC